MFLWHLSFQLSANLCLPSDVAATSLVRAFMASAFRLPPGLWRPFCPFYRCSLTLWLPGWVSAVNPHLDVSLFLVPSGACLRFPLGFPTGRYILGYPLPPCSLYCSSECRGSSSNTHLAAIALSSFQMKELHGEGKSR